MKLQTPFTTADQQNLIEFEFPPKPTRSPYTQKCKPLRWSCSHAWDFLYTEPVYFCQEHLGDHLHWACVKCGEIKVEEKS